jgi:phosphoribosyl-ATP pyrophosphohydrolase
MNKTENNHSKKQETEAMLKETAIIAASNSACTPINFVLETVKSKKQEKPEKSYTSLVKGLYQKGGHERFFRGYSSYLVRNTAGCFFGSGAIVASLHSLKESDASIPAKMLTTSVAEGVAETMLFPIEINELTAKTSKSKSENYTEKLFTKEVAKKGLNAAGFAASRNIIFGAGIVIPYMMGSSSGVSFTSGIAAGLISLPFDVATTRAFAQNTNPAQTIKNILKADKKTALAGAMIRGVQIGLYSLATNQALHYNDNHNESISR